MKTTFKQTAMLTCLFGAVLLKAQEPVSSGQGATSKTDLAAAAQNPVAAMISLPLQNNMTFGVGPGDDIQNVLNVQPVYPISMSSDWNLITRTVLPIVSQPSYFDGSSTFGLGDTSVTGWFSPAAASKITWGVGATGLLPTSTDDVLGAGQWGIGPSAIVVYIEKPWVAGFLASNTWGLNPGDDDRVNSFLFQYFINYNLDGGWYLVSAPIMTANWDADSSDRWTIPIGGGFGRVFKVGKQPMNVNSQIFYNIEKPSTGGDWQWRLQVQWMFPK